MFVYIFCINYIIINSKSKQQLVTQDESCGWYAQLLDNYISDVKTDYDPFVRIFTGEEINTMITHLHPNKCPKNIYKNVRIWLTDALPKQKEMERMQALLRSTRNILLHKNYNSLNPK